MVDRFLKSISYILHPLFMPLLGVIFYFYISPRYIPVEVRQAKLVSLVILTIVLPLALYSLLKTLGKAKSMALVTTKERILPLLLNCIIMYEILSHILKSTLYIELYFFFIGILISTITCLVLAIAKFKASIHMIAISGVFMFFIALSVHFSININSILVLMTIAIGAVATSRLHLKAHTNLELIIGFSVGFFPQLILVTYWL